MVNIPLVVFSLLVCGSPFLTGCGVVARLQAIDTNQRIKANASVARTAIAEHAKTQELFAEGAKTFSSSTQLQSQGGGLSFEDQARIERAKRQEEELAEHEDVMGQLRRTHEIEIEIIKHDQLKEQLRQGRQINLPDVNARLVKQAIFERYGLTPE